MVILILTLTVDLSCYILNVIAKIKNKIEKTRIPSLEVIIWKEVMILFRSVSFS